jgi:hypothetical protein
VVLLAFGSNGDFRDEDSDGEELVEEAMTPTAIDGIVIGRESEEGKEGKEGKE